MYSELGITIPSLAHVSVTHFELQLIVTSLTSPKYFAYI